MGGGPTNPIEIKDDKQLKDDDKPKADAKEPEQKTQE
jgi:hypothetical protein